MPRCSAIALVFSAAERAKLMNLWHVQQKSRSRILSRAKPHTSYPSAIDRASIEPAVAAFEKVIVLGNAEILRSRQTGAVLAQMVFHDKEGLVLLRPFKRGLLLQFLCFKNDIRDFNQIGKGEDEKVSSDEIDPAKHLLENRTSAAKATAKEKKRKAGS